MVYFAIDMISANYYTKSFNLPIDFTTKKASKFANLS